MLRPVARTARSAHGRVAPRRPGSSRHAATLEGASRRSRCPRTRSSLGGRLYRRAAGRAAWIFRHRLRTRPDAVQGRHRGSARRHSPRADPRILPLSDSPRVHRSSANREASPLRNVRSPFARTLHAASTRPSPAMLAAWSSSSRTSSGKAERRLSRSWETSCCCGSRCPTVRRSSSGGNVGADRVPDTASSGERGCRPPTLPLAQEMTFRNGVRIAERLVERQGKPSTRAGRHPTDSATAPCRSPDGQRADWQRT